MIGINIEIHNFTGFFFDSFFHNSFWVWIMKDFIIFNIPTDKIKKMLKWFVSNSNRSTIKQLCEEWLNMQHSQLLHLTFVLWTSNRNQWVCHSISRVMRKFDRCWWIWNGVCEWGSGSARSFNKNTKPSLKRLKQKIN